MKTFTLGTLGMAAVISGPLVAADAAFQNHLSSPIMVSPTQINQVEDTKTDFALGYSLKTDTNKSDGKSTENLNSSTDVFAGGVFIFKDIGLRTGLTASYEAKSEETEDKVALEGSEMTVSPQAAFSAGPIVIGAAVDVVQVAYKPKESEEMSTDYFRFRPGVAYSNENMEAGIVYTSPTRKENPDELKVQEPALVTLHGRYGITSDLALGGIVTNKNYKPIDEEAFTDQLLVKGTAEYLAPNFKVEGNMGYSSAYYENKEEDLSQDTIANFIVGAGGDYALNKTATLGASASYEFGSDSNKTVEVAKNTIGVAVRGNVKF